jgi:hypothetical protein
LLRLDFVKAEFMHHKAVGAGLLRSVLRKVFFEINMVRKNSDGADIYNNKDSDNPSDNAFSAEIIHDYRLFV